MCINSQLAWGKVPPYFFSLVKYSVFRIDYFPIKPLYFTACTNLALLTCELLTLALKASSAEIMIASEARKLERLLPMYLSVSMEAVRAAFGLWSCERRALLLFVDKLTVVLAANWAARLSPGKHHPLLQMVCLPSHRPHDPLGGLMFKEPWCLLYVRTLKQL